MIYLLRVSYKNNPSYWKIGYASDIQKRFSQYEAHNPLVELVAFKEGDLFSEKIHHKYFHLFPQFIDEFYKDEWYITDHMFIREAFLEVPLEGMCDLIWERRDESLGYNDYNLWCELRKGRDCSIINDIDKKMLRIAEKSICPDIDNIPEDLKPLEDVLLSISGSTRFDDKLRIYCEFRELNKTDESLTSGILYHYGKSRLEFLYNHFGIKDCRAQGFRFDRLERLLSDELNGEVVKSGVHRRFVLKEKYSLKVIKEILKDLYSELSINRTAKATDILEYFVVKEVSLVDPNTGKRARGYQLISIK